ncbi:hypothetical protein OQA88_5732 [Cercophora sp. LCS_1]
MASAPTSTPPGAGFDASKQGKASQFLNNAPKDEPAVYLGYVSPDVGYGLFAARDLAKDEFIFHEAPIMTALFNEKFASDKHLMQTQHAAYQTALAENYDALVAAYPRFAAQNGLRPLKFHIAEPVLTHHLDKYLVHGRYAGTMVSQAQYESYTTSLEVSVRPSGEDCRRACLDFFKHYAFETTKKGAGGIPTNATGSLSPTLSTAHDACIYLLGSLINHCCTPPTSSIRSKMTTAGPGSGGGGPNCSWRIGPSGLAHFVRPKHICVQARRDIKKDEQLTWDYGKRDKGFVCECDTCRDSIVGHCRML